MSQILAGIPGYESDNHVLLVFLYSQLVKYAFVRSKPFRMQIGQFSTGMEGFDPGRKFGAEFFSELISEAVSVAEERNVALYCGEFGVIDRAAPEDALEWYRMICSVFDRYGIGRAAWSYRMMDFGLIDDHMKDVSEELIGLL